MNWKPEQKVEGKWYANDLCFATKEEASDAARFTNYSWTQSEGWRVVESNDPVNHKREDGKSVAI